MNHHHLDAGDAETALRRRARRRVGLKLGWVVHATVFVAVNALLAVISAWSSRGMGMAWHWWPLGGWGVGLAIHGLVVLFALRGEGLKDRMVEDEMRRLRDGGTGGSGR